MNNRLQSNISHVCGADQGEEMTLQTNIFMKSIILDEKWLSTTAGLRRKTLRAEKPSVLAVLAN